MELWTLLPLGLAAVCALAFRLGKRRGLWMVLGEAFAAGTVLTGLALGVSLEYLALGAMVLFLLCAWPGGGKP